jgi:hypothetical protein
MDFMQAIFSFIKSLFSRKPASKKANADIRRIETAFRNQHPLIYKRHFVQPVFADSLYIIYTCTGFIGQILFDTVFNPARPVASAFSKKLVITTFTENMKTTLESLSYENLQKERLEAENKDTIFEEQRQRLDSFLEMLTAPSFLKIETIFAQLEQFADICRNNYVTALSLFDTNFVAGNPKYKPAFSPVPIADLESFIAEFAYLTGNFTITESMSNAIIALATMARKSVDKERIVSYLQKINSVFKTVLTNETLLRLYRIIKNDSRINIDKCRYSSDVISRYSGDIADMFKACQQRLKVETVAEGIMSQLPDLFRNKELAVLNGYNAETNTALQKISSSGFLWILPMQILKSFLITYLNVQTRQLLTEIGEEGFFCDLTFKSKYIALLQLCSETENDIMQFEELFNPENGNYEKLIADYLKSYGTDTVSHKKLAEIVDTVNSSAKEIIQNAAISFRDFEEKITELFSDARRSEAAYITNIKGLLSTPRNREKGEIFERRLQRWPIFISIMQNYARQT